MNKTLTIQSELKAELSDKTSVSIYSMKMPYEIVQRDLVFHIIYLKHFGIYKQVIFCYNIEDFYENKRLSFIGTVGST